MKPIRFNTDMVLAIQAGRKSQTRRPFKPQPGVYSELVGWKLPECTHVSFCHGPEITSLHTPPYDVGDVLYVKEKHAIVPSTAYAMSEGVVQTINPHDPYEAAVYAAGWDHSPPSRWSPDSHMPSWAARIYLLVRDVRVERVHDITEDDAKSEGVGVLEEIINFPQINEALSIMTHRAGFAHAWESIYGWRGYGYDSNPWVWVIDFEKIEKL